MLRIEQCSGAMAKNGSASLRKGTVQKGSAWEERSCAVQGRREVKNRHGRQRSDESRIVRQWNSGELSGKGKEELRKATAK